MRFPLPPRANAGYLGVSSIPLFTAAECDRLIEMCSDGWRPAGITGYEREGRSPVRPNVRSALSQRLPVDGKGWPLTSVSDAVARANSDRYRFDLTGYLDRDPPSVLFYESSVVDHFRPHRDAGPEFATRKLSCTVQLSDPSEYEGGALVFPEDHGMADRTRGMLTVFPSFLIHEVTPVVAGSRYVLVAWVHGPSFR